MLRARSGEIAGGRRSTPCARLLRDEIRRRSTGRAGRAAFSARPWVVFVVGVNGVGKTTTIGKLAQAWKAEGRSVLLCAADTFRAAAAEQLEVWAERTGAPFHRGAEGADPSAVLTDALRARASPRLRRGAGRHRGPAAHQGQPDGGAGQDGARRRPRGARARPTRRCSSSTPPSAPTASPRGASSRRPAGVTGLVLTKLDGTAKGGVAVAVVRELGVPIRYVGVGETVDDLLPFDADAFAAGLVGRLTSRAGSTSRRALDAAGARAGRARARARPTRTPWSAA